MTVELCDDILLKVEKPARYTGNEWNMVKKDKSAVDMRFALCFPDTYEIGMSNLGIKILYHLMNKRTDTYCERVFAPWTDMESKMRERRIPLFALETKDPVSVFDIVGFTLQYEMSYTNILNMLDLAGIPLLSQDRSNSTDSGERFPILCAGGPCAFNPEPLAPIFDFFFIGEAEEAMDEIIDIYLQYKRDPQKHSLRRRDLLESLSKIEGVYVPGLSERTVVRKRIVKDLDAAYYPDRIIVPHIGIVHDRVMLEIFRGCSRGCRFCQAGFIYRPVRERSVGRLAELGSGLVESTGYDEVSLSSLSTSDYSSLEALTSALTERFGDRQVSLSLPSMRIDSFSSELMKKASIIRKSGITLAPEAGTQRLRDVINKGVTENDLLSSVKIAFEGGWNNIKLYFMIGLPTETDEDIEGIAVLADKVANEYFTMPREKRRNKLNITVSIATFVPKPHTPFQWEAQASLEELNRRIALLRSLTRSKKYINLIWHDPKLSVLEAVFARGDKKTCDVLMAAWRKGCRFDAWDEHFGYDRWMEAFSECDMDPADYTERARPFDEVMPWDHIDSGVTVEYLYSERNKAYKGELTGDCRLNCMGCGVSRFMECK